MSTRQRGTRLAMALSIAGGAAVVAGGFADGYFQSVALELGAAFSLVAPLVWMERVLADQFKRQVSDSLAEALNGTASSAHPDDVTRIRRHLLDRLNGSSPWQAVRAERASFDLVLENGPRRVAVAIKRTPFALDSATVSRLYAEAKREGIPELVVISLTDPTDLARSFAANTPGLTLLDESDSLNAWLEKLA
ncbi:restriction endonuclease [Lentzea sp. NPDC051838]|uniref:restriction endonuclease n=1 Tax=Lentzea sp. NPDC051838 TaxID=3154849 RepID=UPI003428D4E8